MSFFVSRKLRRLAAELIVSEETREALSEVEGKYGLSIDPDGPLECVQALIQAIKRVPPKMVKDCEIKDLGFRDMGPSKEFYPNHGVYCDGKLYLNTQLLDDPMLDTDPDTGKMLNRFDYTLIHELGHGLDEVLGKRKCKKKGWRGRELSLRPEWMDLSGWSQKPKKGLKRLIIRDPGSPEVRGEYCYSPDAGFARFYGKRNPWDDWADAFAYYVGGLKGFLPKNKIEYFDDVLSPYYEGE
ncbi:MAG: hypothetical protein GF334_07210 [Candidatus Altiarchaeales archaeon]|nr:hypothetical protein [Candidatus Altiarchaeales archaeon]